MLHHRRTRRSALRSALLIPGLLTAIPALGAVGRTEVTWDVSASGAAQYTIPIRVTEGINGLTPRLAVSYSGGQRSILGVGFVLAGLSAISPCRRTVVQDGVAAPVGLASGDRYCLDGSRLRLISGTWGASESVYRTEIDQLARITAKESTAQNIPGWFLVETRDGMRYEYGRTTDSQLGFQFWAVNKIFDREGNSITFTYDMNAGLSRFRPLEIQYTHSNQGPAKYKILFVYQSGQQPGPSDQITPGNAGGGHHLETHLLERIDLQHEGLTYRDYRFVYETGAGANSRLQSVQECVPTNDCLPSTIFTWTSAVTGHSGATDVTGSNGGAPLDINGDGYEDFAWSESGTWRFKWGGPSGLGATVNSGIASYGGARPLEWNGDGRMDLLVNWSDNKFRVLQGTATGFAAPVHAGPGGIPHNTASSDWQVVDYDGDGKDDLLRLRTTSTAELFIRVNGSSGFGSEASVFTDPWLMNMGFGFLSYPYGSSAIRRPDFNGDGRTDLLLNLCEWDYEFQQCMWWGWYYLTASSSGYQVQASIPDATYLQQPRLGDFNHDGLTDIAYAGQSWGMFCFGLGQGGGGMIVSCGPTTAGYSLLSMLIGDYDGDGYDDLYVTQTSPVTWSVIRSTGTGISAQGTQIPTGVSFGGGFWYAGDYTGDGLIDIARSLNGTWSMFAHLGAPGDQFVSSTDGLANKVTFSYLPMTSATIYTKGTGATPPERDYQTAMQLVHTMLVEPAGGISYTLTHQYAGARIDPRGRGFLGMASRTTTDSRNGVAVTETFRQDFPYIGALASVTTKQPGGVKIIESVVHEYDKHVLNSTQYNERYLPYRFRTTTNQREVGGSLDNQVITEIKDTRTVNTLGNTTLAVVEATDKDSGSSEFNQKYVTSVSAAYNEDQGNWCLAIPTSRVETRMLPNLTGETRTTQWTVSACRVTQEVIEPNAGSSLSLTTDLGYDNCGNVNSITSYPAGQPGLGRVTTVGYGSRCQLPETITNPEGHQNRVEYSWPLGLAAAYTDPNEFNGALPKKTLTEYDGFGREIRLVRKDGTATRTALAACTSGNNWCGKGGGVRVKITRTERDTFDTLLRTDEEFLDGFGRERFSHVDSLESGPSMVESQYDAFGRTSQLSQPYFIGGSVYWTVWQRDLLGRAIQETAPTNRISNWSYSGRTVTHTDPLGLTITYVYSVLDQLRTVQEPTPGGVTTQTYSPFGQLKTIADAANNVTQWNYNLRGFVDTTSDPDSGSVLFETSAFGEVLRFRDAKTSAPSWTTQFTYDKLSRPLTRSETEGTTNFYWGNSAAAKNIGRLEHVTSPGSYSEYFQFDDKGRLSQQIVNADGGSYQLNLGYHAQKGLLETIEYPVSTSSYRLKIAHDYANNVLKRVRDANGSTIFWEAVSSNALGDYQDEQFGNNVRTFTQFDPATGWMTARTGGVGGGSGLINIELHSDAIGNLLYRKDLRQAPNVTEDFFYDVLHRFDYSRRNGATNADVALDAIGNINSKLGVGSYTYGATQKRAVASAGGTAYLYDANGNMTSRAGSSISYASYNLPTLINAPGGNSSTLSYGAFRNRYKQVAVSPGSTETTIYVSELLEKVSRTGLATDYRHYIRGGNGVAAIYTRRSDGSSSTYYFHKDHQGSPELITNASGGELVRLSFTAYGERRDGNDWDGPVPPGDMTALAHVTRRGFTGHEHLDNVGLIHMNGRVYDPLIGRFLGADPIVVAGVSQAINPYSYVWNNPLNFTDPSGFCTSPDGCPPAFGPVNYGLPPEWALDPFKARIEITWAIPPAPAYESPAMQVPKEGSGTFGGELSLTPPTIGIYRAVGIKHAAFGDGHQAIVDQLTILAFRANLPADMEEPGLGDFMLNSSVEIALTYGEDSWQSYFWDVFAGSYSDTAREIKSGEYTQATVSAVQSVFKPLKVLKKLKKGSSSRIDRGKFRKEREEYWKREAEAKPGAYSPEDLDRMKRGKPPIGSDGKPVELHHRNGDPTGPLEPMTMEDHRRGENYKKNHPWVGK